MSNFVTRTIAVALLVAGLSAATDSAASTSASATIVAVPESALATPRSAVRDSAVTTIFLVRHAEKNVAYAGNDPPLSEQGAKRAETLAHVLGDAGISAIYSTHWRRCKETALPLAKRSGDSLRIDEQDGFARFARRLRDDNPGGRVLVIGHSDTVPQILEQLLGAPAKSFGAADYDAMFVVTVPNGGRPRWTKLRYGAPIPVTP